MFLPRLFAIALLFIFGASGVTQDKQDKQPQKKKERPSQEAVLAKNTLVLADKAFGSDEKHRLDVYAPKGAKGAPIVIFIHGGEWTKGDKSAVSFKPKFLNENGVVFISTNYRLSPAHKHPASCRL